MWERGEEGRPSRLEWVERSVGCDVWYKKKKEREQKGVEAVVRAATLFGDGDRRQSCR